MKNGETLKFKPDKIAFLFSAYYRMIIVVFFGLVLLAAGLFLIKTTSNIIIILIIFAVAVFAVLLLVYAFINPLIAYQKESYLFSSKQLLIKKGGLLFNSQAELNIKNITDLDLVLPFFENLLFHTGHLLVRSSGASLATNVMLLSLKDYQRCYDKVIELMKANGFSLEHKHLVYQAVPTNTGIILNLLKGIQTLFYSVFWLAFILVPVFFGVLSESSSTVFFLMLMAVGFVGLVFLAGGVIYLDLKRRKYLIYNDAVVFNKGFLTRHYSIIPVENLADSVSSQRFLQRIFGVYDIQISSKGIATEIVFENLEQGEKVEKAIDNMVGDYLKSGKADAFARSRQISEETKTNVLEHLEKPAPEGRSTYQRVTVHDEAWQSTDFTASSQMQFLRSVLPSIFGLIALILLTLLFAVVTLSAGNSEEAFSNVFYLGFFTLFSGINVIRSGLKVLFTRYLVNENEIREEYKFLSSVVKTFTFKKITGVIVVRNVFDFIFETCTVKFLSIGAAYSLNFQNIKYDKIFLAKLQEKFGFKAEDKKLDEIRADFNLTNLAKGSIGTVGILLILWLVAAFLLLLITGIPGLVISFSLLIFGIVAAAVLFVIAYFYGIFLHKRTLLTLYSDKIIAQKGLLIQSEHYVHLANIKSISATKFPFTDNGILQINIAGDILPEQKNNRRKNAYQGYLNAMRSSSVHLNYLTDVFKLARLLEALEQLKINTGNYQRSSLMEFQEEKLLQTKTYLPNEIFALLFLLLSIIILWPLFPIALAVMVYILKRRYLLYQDKVTEVRGIINITRTSVLFNDIDNINLQQGAVNKLFNSACIYINTSGSIAPEINVRNIKSHQEFYRLLQSMYKK
ncbi:MAG TPA: PH domain-containing protein [Candidatus Dojkabacteria bacterium]|nr:PH domain-containing protein [Candidatus Dojkabacteria bacterium]